MHRIVAATGICIVLLSGCAADAEMAQEPPATEAAPPTQATPATSEPAPETPTAEESPTAAGTAPPVSLEGTVNNEGIAQLRGDMLEMELDDFDFEPTFVQAEPGTSVTIEMHNEGDAAHTFTIDELGIDEVVDPGQRVEVEVTLPDELPQRFYCRFHVGQGMQGAFFTG